MHTTAVQNSFIQITISKKSLYIGAGMLLLLAGLVLAGHIAANLPTALLAQ